MDRLKDKKIIIYFIAGVIALGAAWFIFDKIFLTDGERAGQTPPESTSGRLPAPPPSTIAPGGEQTSPSGQTTARPREPELLRLTDFSVVSPSLDKTEKKILFYKKDGGGMFSSNFNGGDLEKLSNITLVGIMEAVWSPNRDRSAVFYLDKETVKGFLQIGTSTSEVAILPQDIKSLSWSPDGKSLAYLLSKGGRIELVIADSAGKNPKTVFSTPLLDIRLDWISPDKIVLSTLPSGLAEGFVFVWTRSGGALNKIAGPLWGLETNWAPDGSKFLASFTDRVGKNLATSLLDLAGKEVSRLDIQTVADKCAWANAREFYCAAPVDPPPNAVWPDDYLRGEFNTSDELKLFDTEDKKTELVAKETGLDVSDPILTSDQKYLFFVNKKDGRLWSLRLK